MAPLPRHQCKPWPEARGYGQAGAVRSTFSAILHLHRPRGLCATTPASLGLLRKSGPVIPPRQVRDPLENQPSALPPLGRHFSPSLELRLDSGRQLFLCASAGQEGPQNCQDLGPISYSALPNAVSGTITAHICPHSAPGPASGNSLGPASPCQSQPALPPLWSCALGASPVQNGWATKEPAPSSSLPLPCLLFIKFMSCLLQ